MFLNIFKHLLPNARAWRLIVDKQLRQFFDGLSVAVGDDIKTFLDGVFSDIDPQTTRELVAYETQFGLRDTGLTEQERRDRLAATWRALGGQDPRYIQDTLQANGFDVYVHEWWTPGSEPAPDVKACVTPRNPTLYLRDSGDSIIYLTGAGEPLMEAGEATAEAGERLSLPGYILVNKVFKTSRNVLSLSGELFMEAGEADAISGNYNGFVETPVEYFIPTDAAKWPYFLYIGGQIFGGQAQIDPKRKDEFEALCLKICPAQQWLGIIVEYV